MDPQKEDIAEIERMLKAPIKSLENNPSTACIFDPLIPFLKLIVQAKEPI